MALINDPRHADHWRGTHSGTPGGWFEDALSSAESTARGLVSQVLRTRPRHLLVCGDSTLTLAILLELARRAWEQAELVKAAAAGRAAAPGLPPPPDAPAPLPLASVALLDLRSPDIKREYLASAPNALLGSLPAVAAHPVRWRDHLLRTLDAMDRPRPGRPPSSSRRARRGAGCTRRGGSPGCTRRPRCSSSRPRATGMGGAIFDLLHPFEHGLLIEGEVPEDTWTRVARHWHECYRLSHPLPPGHPQSPARLPWPELDPFLSQDNILQLRSILSAVRGVRQAVGAGPPGAAGQRHRAERAGPDGHRDRRAHPLAAARLAAGRPGEFVVPWTELPDHMRDEMSGTWSRSSHSWRTWASCRSSRPAARRGRPASSASACVRASQLSEPLAWTTHAGEQMHGFAGDWHVVDDAGNMRTVTDPDFQASHEPLGDGRWRRIGVYRAWQVEQAVVIRTKEGKATAQPGDWVVEAPTGERWPVRDEQFRWSYRPSPDQPAAGTAGPGERARGGEQQHARRRSPRRAWSSRRGRTSCP